MTEKTPAKKAPVRRTRKAAVKAEVAPSEKKQYEFMEELPNKQQAAPVKAVADGQTDTRVTEAMTDGEKEPKKVEADEAIDTTTLEQDVANDHPVDVSDELEIAPVEQPETEYAGGDQTDTRVTAAIEDEDEDEPEKVDADEAIMEPQEDQLTDEQKDMDHPPVSPKSKKLNAKTRRLSKNRGAE